MNWFVSVLSAKPTECGCVPRGTVVSSSQMDMVTEEPDGAESPETGDEMPGDETPGDETPGGKTRSSARQLPPISVHESTTSGGRLERHATNESNGSDALSSPAARRLERQASDRSGSHTQRRLQFQAIQKARRSGAGPRHAVAQGDGASGREAESDTLEGSLAALFLSAVCESGGKLDDQVRHSLSNLCIPCAVRAESQKLCSVNARKEAVQPLTPDADCRYGSLRRMRCGAQSW